jgi:hypothetical protein
MVFAAPDTERYTGDGLILFYIKFFPISGYTTLLEHITISPVGVNRLSEIQTDVMGYVRNERMT